MLVPTLFKLYFSVAIRLALDEHQLEDKSVKVVYMYLHNGNLVGNRRMLRLKTLVTDLEYGDDMALLVDNWSDLTTTSCRQLGLTITCKKSKSLATLPPESSDIQCPALISLAQGEVPIKVVPIFSTYKALSRMTVGRV